MSKKKIKKIDEFISNETEFEIRIWDGELSDVEISERKDISNKAFSESIKSSKKVKMSDTLDIDFYREMMLDLKKMGECSFTDEELDQNCMETYGELFFVKNEEDNNE